ncbi:hypothetical protein Tco_0565664 [Tanacetum coccineum]
MSSASTVTYISVFTDSELGRVFWGADEELSDGGSPRVIVYRYDRLPMHPVAPPSSDYVPGPEHPPSPNYVPGPEHPPSPVEVPYVPDLEYPEYLLPSDDEAPWEDPPLPTDALPVALSPGYVADSDPEEDPEEDSEEDHVDYPTDGGDDDDEPSDDDDDDDDTDDEDEEPFEDEDDDGEEEEHLAPTDSSAIPVVDPIPSAGDTEAFETDEAAPIHNNIPPRRSSATARAAAVATPMTTAVVEQIIEARVSTALSNHETLRNSTNGQGDKSYNSNTRIRGTVHTPRECTYKDFLNCKPLSFKGTEGVVVLSQWFEKMELVFHISNCAVENQVKFATYTFFGNALTWWNSYKKTVTQDVAYAMD